MRAARAGGARSLSHRGVSRFPFPPACFARESSTAVALSGREWRAWVGRRRKRSRRRAVAVCCASMAAPGSPPGGSTPPPPSQMLGGQSVWQSATLSSKVGHTVPKAGALSADAPGSAHTRRGNVQVPAASKGLTITLAGLRHTFVVRRSSRQRSPFCADTVCVVARRLRTPRCRTALSSSQARGACTTGGRLRRFCRRGRARCCARAAAPSHLRICGAAAFTR